MLSRPEQDWSDPSGPTLSLLFYALHDPQGVASCVDVLVLALLELVLLVLAKERSVCCSHGRKRRGRVGAGLLAVCENILVLVLASTDLVLVTYFREY